MAQSTSNKQCQTLDIISQHKVPVVKALNTFTMPYALHRALFLHTVNAYTQTSELNIMDQEFISNI